MPLVGEATSLNSGLQIWPEKWRVEGATAERDGVRTTQGPATDGHTAAGEMALTSSLLCQD